MKVLWFSVTPSLYDINKLSHNGGGWISSLEKLIRQNPNINLGIAFEHQDTCFKVVRERVVYYPMKSRISIFDKFFKKIHYVPEEKYLIETSRKVIEDFKPDIIQVFGSEWCFGLVTQITKIPVIIHMQGSLPSYYNARFPSGYNIVDQFLNNGINFKRTLRDIVNDKSMQFQAKREEKVLRNCKYFMGRTEWDKNITKIYSPNSTYFYCSEALRESFTNIDISWHPTKNGKLILISTLSSPIYKGFDVILKTAKILKENLNFEFEWRVFGVAEIKFHEWKTKINSTEVNIRLMGSVSEDILKDELLFADIYIHPSYIDNSPNSVCEAQILGLPVICTYVGGLSSIVKNNETGLLVPANDPYSLAANIQLLLLDKNFAIYLGENARKVALVRHNPQQILNDLLSIYNKVISNEKVN
jgi:glycosyltransferase involved in cell wall biosynthesis